MKNMLRLDLYRMIHGFAFKAALILSALLGIWCLGLNVHEHYRSLEALQNQTIAYSYPYSVYNGCISADGVTLPSILLFALLPFLTTLPYGAALAQDLRTGYIKNLAIKTSRQIIYASRYITVFIGAFLVVMFATTGQMLFSMMFLPVLPPEIASFSFPLMTVGHVGASFYAQHPLAYLILYNLFDAVFLAAFASVSIFVAGLVRNAFFALIGPTVLFYALTYLFDFLGLTIYRPDFIITPYVGIALSSTVMCLEAIFILLLSVGLCAFSCVRNRDVF